MLDTLDIFECSAAGISNAPLSNLVQTISDCYQTVTDGACHILDRIFGFSWKKHTSQLSRQYSTNLSVGKSNTPIISRG